MRKETKIALFTIITVALAIWGYKYLRGFNILSSQKTIFAIYDNVDGLRISTPVYVHGLQVGLVASFKQEDANINKIEVEMQISPDVKIPKDAVAEIVNSVMSGATIQLVFNGNCSGDDCLQDKDRIKGITRGIISSLATPEEVKSYVEELTAGLNTLIDTIGQKLSESEELKDSAKDIKAILSNLNSTTTRLDRLMANAAGPLEGSLKNFESISGNLKASNDQIKGILANLDVLSEDLKKADISGLSGDVKKTMQKLQGTLASADGAIDNLSAALNQLKEGGDGAIAMLLHDKAFADKLQVTVKDLDLLLQDIRLHPERYRRVLSKKKMPYELPENDPGRQ
ncbi:MAG: MCE family protein [Lewinellaceae bacterium]|nr:MCE family protein [Saprospiraceae bacterium]MCB9340767.1 MCE family protein [Lewinellaceae bacterium]